METKKAKTEDLETDEVLQWVKNSRARFLRLPGDYDDSRLDVMKALANNRAITTLDLSESEVSCIEMSTVCSVFVPSRSSLPSV